MIKFFQIGILRKLCPVSEGISLIVSWFCSLGGVPLSIVLYIWLHPLEEASLCIVLNVHIWSGCWDVRLLWGHRGFCRLSPTQESLVGLLKGSSHLQCNFLQHLIGFWAICFQTFPCINNHTQWSFLDRILKAYCIFLLCLSPACLFFQFNWR